MQRNVERYCELANKTTQQLYKVSTPCIDDHHFKEEELKPVEEMSKVCSQIVLKCLYLARIGRLDIPWSVNKLACEILPANPQELYLLGRELGLMLNQEKIALRLSSVEETDPSSSSWKSTSRQ